MKTRKKFPTKERMRAARIFNSWNLAELLPPADQFYVDYTPGSTGRGCFVPRIQVTHTRMNTDPEAHWQDAGRKSFLCSRSTKEAATQEAIAWANERFGARTWIRDPFGAHQQIATLDAAWAAVARAETPQA